MPSVKRGKALVASLRAQPGVRDPEALAAYLGRFKAARKAGKSVAKAKAAAGGGGGSSSLADEHAKAKAKNLQKRDEVVIKTGSGVDATDRATVTGKTRDGKIKVQPRRGRERTLDPGDVSPDTRNGKSLNPAGSLGGQTPNDPGYWGKHTPKRRRKKN